MVVMVVGWVEGSEVGVLLEVLESATSAACVRARVMEVRQSTQVPKTSKKIAFVFLRACRGWERTGFVGSVMSRSDVYGCDFGLLLLGVDVEESMVAMCKVRRECLILAVFRGFFHRELLKQNERLLKHNTDHFTSRKKYQRLRTRFHVLRRVLKSAFRGSDIENESESVGL